MVYDNGPKRLQITMKMLLLNKHFQIKHNCKCIKSDMTSDMTCTYHQTHVNALPC